jgi:hypothetical protein
LRALQPNARSLVIVLKAEVMLVEGHQVVFEGCFENTNASYMVTRLSDDYFIFYQLIVCSCC